MWSGVSDPSVPVTYRVNVEFCQGSANNPTNCVDRPTYCPGVVTSTTCSFDFVGGQPGRWRVRAGGRRRERERIRRLVDLRVRQARKLSTPGCGRGRQARATGGASLIGNGLVAVPCPVTYREITMTNHRFPRGKALVAALGAALAVTAAAQTSPSGDETSASRLLRFLRRRMDAAPAVASSTGSRYFEGRRPRSALDRQLTPQSGGLPGETGRACAAGLWSELAQYEGGRLSDTRARLRPGDALAAPDPGGRVGRTATTSSPCSR